MKKLTSLLMLAALTSGALALAPTQSFAAGRSIRAPHKVSMRKHRKAKTTKTGKSRKGSGKRKKQEPVSPAPARNV